MFAYCANDPVNNEDPDGERAISIRRHNPVAVGMMLLTSCVVGSYAYAKSKIEKKRRPYSNPKRRPKYGKNQVEEVWNRAKDVLGRVFDPNTGEELSWDKTKSRAGQWDMGHTKQNKYSKKHKDYRDGKITKEEFLKCQQIKQIFIH